MEALIERGVVSSEQTLEWLGHVAAAPSEVTEGERTSGLKGTTFDRAISALKARGLATKAVTDVTSHAQTRNPQVVRG
jgi:hypothetical protein